VINCICEKGDKISSLKEKKEGKKKRKKAGKETT